MPHLQTILQFLSKATLTSLLSSKSLTQVRPKGFPHASSYAMQKHPSVQASPVLLQEQFCQQPDILHLHFISLRRLTGVCAFVIVSGTRSSSSFVCPWPSSDPRSCIASRAPLQTLCSLIASVGEVHNQSLVEAFHVSVYSCRTCNKIIHLQCLSFWLSCI